MRGEAEADAVHALADAAQQAAGVVYIQGGRS
jgi:hypothetical protein